jgi:hypothetical protein
MVTTPLDMVRRILERARELNMIGDFPASQAPKADLIARMEDLHRGYREWTGDVLRKYLRETFERANELAKSPTAKG